MARLAIIHPEGNFNNNPNLSGLLSLFAEQWDAIDLYAQRHPGLDQSSMHSRVAVMLRDGQPAFPHDSPVLLPSIALANPEISAPVVAKGLLRPDLIIGVDRGIIEASALAKAWDCPVGLISYEIFFANETSEVFKTPEIEACRNLIFAVCQDRARSARLSRENLIPLERIMDIPVAGRGVRRGERSTLVKEALGVPMESRVVLYMGELSGTWNGIDEILESTPQWPDGWALVLHHRYGNGAALDLVEKVLKRQRKNVFFSPFPSLPFDNLGELLFGVDAGLAFYRPVPGHPSSNANLAEIGMASGKISTYLQHGVPVIVNRLGEISDHVEQNGLGGVVSGGEDLPELLSRLSRQPEALDRERCWTFFSSTLDLGVRARPLLDVMLPLSRRG